MSARARLFVAAVAMACLTAACKGKDEGGAPEGGAPMSMRLTSPAFSNGAPIPKRHGFDEQNVSPALRWSGVPANAKSLALICDDPDAPMGTWTHWVIYNLPADSTGLPEGTPATAELANGARQGANDFKRTGYGGPAPPPGKAHRYFFRLYALDVKLDIPAGAAKDELLKGMEGHVVAQGQLMGTFQSK